LEHNGQMDVDPEGLEMYGPYGKPIMNLCTSVISRCKTVVRCSNPMNPVNICTSVLHVCKTPVKRSKSKTAVNKYGDRNAVKVRVRSVKHSYAEIVVNPVGVYTEAVVSNTWSAQ
jgi:hypothetical protein